MGLDKLCRVMEKLDKIKDSDGSVTHLQIVNAIREFCGINPNTIRVNMNTLIELKWINPKYFLTHDYMINESDMF
jgi:hypothetical protein